MYGLKNVCGPGTFFLFARLFRYKQALFCLFKLERVVAETMTGFGFVSASAKAEKDQAARQTEQQSYLAQRKQRHLQQRRLDADLAQRAASGESDAFRTIVDSHAQRVRNLAWRMLGDPNEAEDLAQDVFVSVYGALDRFRGDSQLSTWILRITRNHCINRIKSRGRRYTGRQRLHQEIQATTDDLHTTKSDNNPEGKLRRKQTQAWVQQAIAALPPDQRMLVVLRDIEGLSYDEICAVTDLREGTVKSRLHRARLRLQNWFIEHQQEAPSSIMDAAPQNSEQSPEDK